jgi:hypothetical protein
VTARGLPPLAYQWQLNGIPLPGETGSSLTLLAVNTNRVGNYRVVVSNAYGTNTSQEATLIVDGVGQGGFAPGGERNEEFLIGLPRSGGMKTSHRQV